MSSSHFQRRHLPPVPSRVGSLPAGEAGEEDEWDGWQRQQSIPEVILGVTQDLLASLDVGVGLHIDFAGLTLTGRTHSFGIVLMSFFNFFSHGSQDLYPTVSIVPCGWEWGL